jgi:DnaJ domain
METRPLSYYEDFGVNPDASPGQIRETYKLLVRLLHPDYHTDPGLKRAAEGQMRRINRAYAVLSDPERRRQYDHELYTPPERPAPLVIRTPNAVLIRDRFHAGPLLWICAAVLGLGIILWLATQVQIQQAQTRAQRNIPVEPPPRQQPPDRTVREPQFPRARASVNPSQPIPTTAPPHVPAPVPGVQTMAPPASDPPAFAAPQLPAPEPVHLVHNGFAGFWAYPKEKNFQRQSGQYPPQFIEASIIEHDGVIHGKYRARYYVSDRPISPNVNFEFEGKPEDGIAKIPWHGEGGSQGVLEIKLLAPDELELNWHATDFGQVLGLASGTAVLMRRPD